jgi:hypothetical protein
MVALLVAALLSLAPPAQASPPMPSSDPAASHVFVVVLENHSYKQMIGRHRARYITRLGRRNALLTNYYAITHPSLPNYLAILGGSTFGIDDNCTDCEADDPNLALQLSQAGISWRAYMEGMPTRCYTGAEDGRYAKRHNPFVYFPSIVTRPELCNRVVPADGLGADLSQGSLASFNWITPDLCHDAHDCGIRKADRYLKRLVPKLLANLGPHGFLVLTFDEGTGSRGLDGEGGGRIATVLAGPDVVKETRVATPVNHYSLLRTLERAFGLAYLREARSAQDLGPAFVSFPPLP